MITIAATLAVLTEKNLLKDVRELQKVLESDTHLHRSTPVR